MRVVRQTLMGGVLLRTVYGVLSLWAPRLMFRSAWLAWKAAHRFRATMA